MSEISREKSKRGNRRKRANDDSEDDTARKINTASLN